MISACAELAKRLVSGQGIAPEDEKGSVSNWITCTPKSEATGNPKPMNTLVLVGCVTLYARAQALEDLYLYSTYSIGKERIVKGLLIACTQYILTN